MMSDYPFRWTFFGRIIPERVPVSLGTPLLGHSPAGAFAPRFDFRIIIHLSQLTIDVNILEGNVDILTLRNAVAAQVRIVTDFLGFERGCYLDIEIISAVSKDTDEWTMFGIDIPVLSSRPKRRDPNVLDMQHFSAVGRSIPIQIALADLREAMKVPVGTGFFCYRAIEAMMQSLKLTPDENQNVVWGRLRQILRVERSAIDKIKAHADFPRHGKPSSISDAERADIFKLTAEIIERFIQYHVSEMQPLADTDYPILDDIAQSKGLYKA